MHLEKVICLKLLQSSTEEGKLQFCPHILTISPIRKKRLQLLKNVFDKCLRNRITFYTYIPVNPCHFPKKTLQSLYPNYSALKPNVEFFFDHSYLEKATRVEVVPEAIHGGLKLLAAIELARKFRARQKPVG